MKTYKIHKQVRTALGGEKIDLTIEGDNKDELVEVINHLMPEPVWRRLFGGRKK